MYLWLRRCNRAAKFAVAVQARCHNEVPFCHLATVRVVWPNIFLWLPQEVTVKLGSNSLTLGDKMHNPVNKEHAPDCAPDPTSPLDFRAVGSDNSGTVEN